MFPPPTDGVDRSTTRAGHRPWDRAAPTVRSRSQSRRRRRTPPGLWPGQIEMLSRVTPARAVARSWAMCPRCAPSGTPIAAAQVSGLVQGKSACKPASVPGLPGWRPSIWGRRCRRPRAVHQGTRPGQPPRPRRRGRCVPYSTLLRVGFTEPTGHPAAGALLPHRFTLADPLARAGGLLSVALSCGSPRLAVSQHPALWRPDFPRSRRTGTAAARPAPPARPLCHPQVGRRSIGLLQRR
jgi:hypothetical protein